MMRRATALAVSLACAATIAGCRINVDKNANGEEKNVQVDTPFGGVHVNTNQTSAADLGFPAYPGAQQVKDGDHKSADVRLGFGDWQLRVRVASYATSDTSDQVAGFYRKELGRYGTVITCQGNTPVGTPTVTSEGLTCADSENTKIQMDQKTNGYAPNGLVLKAGSKRHQHIVGFDHPEAGKTKFALVALDLPASGSKQGSKSD